jgi:L-iditol 2-dehydrogenase
VHYYKDGRNGDFELREPIILGHESAGTIVAVGKGLRNNWKVGNCQFGSIQLIIGERVTIEPGVPCSRCEFCIEQQYNLCPRIQFASSCKTFPHVNGTLQTVFNHDEEWVHEYYLK